MVDLDLDELERLAKAAEADWDSKIPTMPLREFHTSMYPPTILALIERVKRAESVIAEALGVARASSVPLGMPEAAFHSAIKREVESVLATYQNGADQ